MTGAWDLNSAAHEIADIVALRATEPTTVALNRLRRSTETHCVEPEEMMLAWLRVHRAQSGFSDIEKRCASVALWGCVYAAAYGPECCAPAIAARLVFEAFSFGENTRKEKDRQLSIVRKNLVPDNTKRKIYLGDKVQRHENARREYWEELTGTKYPGF